MLLPANKTAPYLDIVSTIEGVTDGARSAGEYRAMLFRPISSEIDTFERYLSRHFGEDDKGCLRASGASRAHLTLYRKRSDKPVFGHVNAPAIEDGFLVTIALKNCVLRHVQNGHLSINQEFAADSLHIRNLAEAYSVYLCSPFDFLFLHITQATLDAVAWETGASRIRRLGCQSGLVDPTAASLARTLIPALLDPQSVPGIFVDQIALALTVHIAQAYGDLHIPTERRVGGLSRLQERRAKEIMVHRLTDDLSVCEVAAQCGMSRSYFTKAFKITTGKTPGKWLLDHRLQLAKDLLVENQTGIAEIAVSCGFADQSHLTRVFKNVIGLPPGAWKREYTM